MTTCWTTDAICLIQKTDNVIPFVFTDENDLPINLTGCIVYFTVKRKTDIEDSDDNDAVIKKDITTHTDPTAWETEITLTSEDTDIDTWDYVYNIAVKDVQNNVTASTLWDFNISFNWTKRA